MLLEEQEILKIDLFQYQKIPTGMPVQWEILYLKTIMKYKLLKKRQF